MKNVNTFVPMETEDRGRASELAAGSSQATIIDSAKVRSSRRVADPERARVFADLSAEQKDRYKADIRATNIILQGGTCDENRMMMERFSQPTNDPLALVSNAYKSEVTNTTSESSTTSNQPSLVITFQLDLRKHFQLTLDRKNKATVQDGRVVVQDVRGRYNANNQGRPFQRNNARGNVVAGNAGGNRAHSIENVHNQSDLMILDYFKDKMLLMHAHENSAVLDEEQLLFLAGEQVTNFDDDVDDLALNVDHVFEADQCMHSSLI
ncbi:hypothetical protein Tco_0353590 [Tanacetum coccineum]